ncbi:MAG TPA: LysR family transcriptional regulator [Polyangiaceae bacterium]|jgi:DNA-binding transcriptional LysR family regulator|nr:LysR family transcriptional regulator [Polyangiaceae bacterium]
MRDLDLTDPSALDCLGAQVPMSEPDWNDFKIILALAQGGSVAGASRVLGVDSSTVSRRLAALEESVGACLIVRGQKFAWTAEGRTVLCAAEVVQRAVNDATRAVQSAKASTSLPVLVSCPPGLSAVLARLMSAARESHPELAIELSGENRTVDLAKGEADIALRMFRPTEPGLVCKHVFELGWCVYASKSYLAEHGTPASSNGLGCHRLVRYVKAMHQVPGPRWLEENRGASTSSILVENTEAAAYLVASGSGISVLPAPVADSRLEMVRLFDGPIATAPGYLVYHESARDTARVRAAVSVLTELFETQRAYFSGRPD